MASSSSPCAACKFLRRKCTQGCAFAPYFPADQPRRFENVHRVFGASNVSKLLNELSPTQREDTVNSLAYEADMRLRDPVYGSVGYIFILQHKLRQLQYDLEAARKELAAYIGNAHNPFATGPFYQQLQSQPHNYVAPAVGTMQGMNFGMNLGVSNAATPLQQQLVAVAREQELMRSFEQLVPVQNYVENAFQVPQEQQLQQPLPNQIQYTDDQQQHRGSGGAST